MEQTITHRPTIKSRETSTRSRNNTHTHRETISSYPNAYTYVHASIHAIENRFGRKVNSNEPPVGSPPISSAPWRTQTQTQNKKNKCRRRKGEEYEKESTDFTVPLARVSGILAEIFPNKICSRQLSTLPKAPINFFISDLRLHSWKEPRFLRSLDTRWRVWS